MNLAFFDTKPYDKPGFDEHIAGTDIAIKYFETRLGEDTVQLAKGFDGVCVFVNDTVNEKGIGAVVRVESSAVIVIYIGSTESNFRSLSPNKF